MASKAPAMGKLLLFAGVVTLAVSLLRLWGELADWDNVYVSKEPGGPLALVGIVWLIFVFGFWFGARLVRGGAGPTSVARAIVLHLIAVGAVIGTFVYVQAVEEHDMNTLEGMKSATFSITIGLAIAAVIALVAWPRLWLVNLGYALLARIPVVVITYIACAQQWGTHYEKLGPNDLAAEPMAKAFWLSYAQLTFWPVNTIVFGGLCGSLAALLLVKRK